MLILKTITSGLCIASLSACAVTSEIPFHQQNAGASTYLSQPNSPTAPYNKSVRTVDQSAFYAASEFSPHTPPHPSRTYVRKTPKAYSQLATYRPQIAPVHGKTNLITTAAYQQPANNIPHPASPLTIEYQVKEGETVYGLAREFCSTVQDIQRANRLGSQYTIQVGQTITLPLSTC